MIHRKDVLRLQRAVHLDEVCAQPANYRPDGMQKMSVGISGEDRFQAGRLLAAINLNKEEFHFAKSLVLEAVDCLGHTNLRRKSKPEREWISCCIGRTRAQRADLSQLQRQDAIRRNQSKRIAQAGFEICTFDFIQFEHGMKPSCGVKVRLAASQPEFLLTSKRVRRLFTRNHSPLAGHGHQAVPVDR